MAWRIEISQTARREIQKLSKKAQADIVRFLREKIEPAENPRHAGKALKGDKNDLWRYRIGDYRLICAIQDRVITVLVLRAGHRKEVYRKKYGKVPR